MPMRRALTGLLIAGAMLAVPAVAQNSRDAERKLEKIQKELKSVAAERRTWQVVATDVSIAALAVARINARRHQVESRVHLLAADLVAGLDLSSFDIVLGNPPYVEEEIVPFLSRDVRDFEPRVALTAGPEGLEAYLESKQINLPMGYELKG